VEYTADDIEKHYRLWKPFDEYKKVTQPDDINPEAGIKAGPAAGVQPSSTFLKIMKAQGFGFWW
jgi:hypothetical protein